MKVPSPCHLFLLLNLFLSRLPEFGEGTVGAGRSAVASPYSRKAKAKDARGLDNTANETRSPVKGTPLLAQFSCLLLRCHFTSLFSIGC